MNLKYRGIYSSRKPGGDTNLISTKLEFSEFWVIVSGFVNIVA